MNSLEARLEEDPDDVVISEILGKGVLPEVIMNQKGSRFMQEIYYTLLEEEKEQVFEELKGQWKEIILDKFGNFFIQKIFEHGPDHHKEYFSKQLKG